MFFKEQTGARYLTIKAGDKKLHYFKKGLTLFKEWDGDLHNTRGVPNRESRDSFHNGSHQNSSAEERPPTVTC